MIEWDIFFIMLAKNKCMDAFQMLKSVHFPPYSQLPQSQCVITETSQWNTLLSRDTGSVTAETVVSSSPMFLRTKGGLGGLHCACEQKPRLSLSLPHSANSNNLPHPGERQHIGVRSRAECFQSAECIWAEMCLQTKNWIHLIIERVWTGWVNGHICCQEEGFTSGNMEYPNPSHLLHWAAAKVPPLTYISPTQQV